MLGHSYRTDTNVGNSHVIFSHTSDIAITVGRFRLNALITAITQVTIIPV
jgi:hypothetical protein